MIFVENKRKQRKNIELLYGHCEIIDVTSKAKDDFKKLSPFYPHGGISIPFSAGCFSKSVEGIWQGLKVFEKHGIDKSSFENVTGRNIKRTVRKYGLPLGHQKGVENSELLSYVDARILIYLPSYRFMLEEYCMPIIDTLREASLKGDVVLIDYTTNGDVYDTKTPLSHAKLVKAYCDFDFDKLVHTIDSTEKTL